MAGDLIIRSDVIRYLGVWMDSSLNFKTHTTKKCQSAMINFLKIRKIRHLLNTDTHSKLMPKSVHFTSRLLQCCTLQHPKGHPYKATAYTEHVCTLSAKKIEKG